MTVFQKDDLPLCIEEFAHINRYHDLSNDVVTAKILPGEFYVSTNGEMITTVLGSCISACIRDPLIGVGGMNHFMLPLANLDRRQGWQTDHGAISRYGDFAMEMLINTIIKLGGKRKNLEVKLFGGGKVLSQITSIDVGQQNIEFAHQYLNFEGLEIVAEDTGDIYPRKVNFYSDTGRVMIKKLKSMHNDIITRREDSYHSEIELNPKNTLEIFK